MNDARCADETWRSRRSFWPFFVFFFLLARTECGFVRKRERSYGSVAQSKRAQLQPVFVLIRRCFRLRFPPPFVTTRGAVWEDRFLLRVCFYLFSLVRGPFKGAFPRRFSRCLTCFFGRARFLRLRCVDSAFILFFFSLIMTFFLSIFAPLKRSAPSFLYLFI